jgi:hypothetical protein
MRFRRVVVLGMVVVNGTGCTGWHSTGIGQPTPIKDGKLVRVTLRNGKRIEIAGVKVTDDSISGRRLPDRAHVAVAVGDVVKIEDRKLSAGNTIGGILLLLGMTALIGLAAIASSLNAL